jgi:ribosomal protein S18 acetylase RimI-like enzyme
VTLGSVAGPADATVTCRPARRDDLRAVTTVHVRAWQRAYRGILPQHHLDSLDIDEAVNRRAERWPWPGSHIAELDGAVAGWLAIGPYRGADAPPGSGEIYALYVDPDHWARGVGTALMSYGLPLLAAMGLRPVFLWVLRDNARAQRFYLHHGFVADGAEEGYEAGGATVPEVRYRHDVPTDLLEPAVGPS